MRRVASVKPLRDWQLEAVFDNGTCGVISIEDRLFGPVFEALKDPALFERVAVDEFGVICWPNGADLAPDALYETLMRRSRVA